MLTLTIKTNTPSDRGWEDRINGSVCMNDSRIGQTGAYEYTLFYSELGVDFGRSNLTPIEISTFVRVFYDEGFDDRIEIKSH